MLVFGKKADDISRDRRVRAPNICQAVRFKLLYAAAVTGDINCSAKLGDRTNAADAIDTAGAGFKSTEGLRLDFSLSRQCRPDKETASDMALMGCG